MTTLSGTQLSGATIVLPASSVATSTGSYTTVATLGGSVTNTIGATQTGGNGTTATGPTASTFTGMAIPGRQPKDSSILITLLTGLLALI